MASLSLLKLNLSSIFAFSTFPSNAEVPVDLSWGSRPSSFLNSSANQSMIASSKSSPPRCVSPFVDFTSNTPSLIQGLRYRYYQEDRYAIVESWFFYLIRSESIVGSLMILFTFKPAISYFFRCLTLRIVEVCWNGNYRFKLPCPSNLLEFSSFSEVSLPKSLEVYSLSSI